jgi:hypothetical protein
MSEKTRQPQGNDAYVCALESTRLDERGPSLTIDELLKGMEDFGRTHRKMLGRVMKDLARYDGQGSPYRSP